jgi:hypothetical protein
MAITSLVPWMNARRSARATRSLRPRRNTGKSPRRTIRRTVLGESCSRPATSLMVRRVGTRGDAGGHIMVILLCGVKHRAAPATRRQPLDVQACERPPSGHSGSCEPAMRPRQADRADPPRVLRRSGGSMRVAADRSGACRQDCVTTKFCPKKNFGGRRKGLEFYTNMKYHFCTLNQYRSSYA